MTQPLVIVGAGGFARETAAAVHACNEVRPTWQLRGFLDDNPALHGTDRDGLPILGPADAVADMEDIAVVVCVGSPRDYTPRRRLVERLDLPTDRYATVVHPSASVGPDCLVGPGSVLLAHTVLTANVTVESHVAVMPHTVFTHDDVVSEYVTIGAGVRLGGGAVIEQGAYLGAGVLVRELVRVGEWSFVGMGSVVLCDIPPAQVWIGHPARFLRAIDLPVPPSIGTIARELT
jgi:sugar O-acyltransferase (sialic acid O-acetyltransferase NeuD family)